MNAINKSELEEYVKTNVECFEERYEYALILSGKMRCPLDQADDMLCDDIRSAAECYCMDNDIDPDFDEILDAVEELFGME